jgi:hypothetical protein
MRKEHLDLENGTVWIPDSKTPNGVAEVSLTDIAIEAFRSQLARLLRLPVARHVAPGGRPVFSDLRFTINVRHAAQRRRSC